MKFTNNVLIILLAAVLFAGCATIKGTTVAEQRQYVLDMRDETLARLYSEYPIAKEQIKKAAGYGVFSNINTNLFLLSTGSGYGVVTDNKKPTYMNMRTVGGGLGLGVKDFRAVIIFRKRKDMEKFVEKGWEFGGQADATFKSGDKGGAYSAAQSVDLDIITYQLTESGAALQATLQGTKYWKHKDLNY
ncbi:MAG: lipid-binding SYLF domain-containing protein [Planctomycetota bacterium]|jgi:lipid-binding SYLF domain-containing protein